MLRRTAAITVGAWLFASACGPMNTTGDGGPGDPATDANTPTDGTGSTDAPRSCPTPCACADRGPPDYSRETTGMPAASADDRQRASLVRANHWRTAAGLGAQNGNAQIQAAANSHAQYLANTPQATCWPSPHQEVMTCSGFSGASMADRMTAAGYQWMRASEVINWEGDATAAIDGWIWTVYHRQPFMDYRLPDTGYGYSNGTLGGQAVVNNVMDFGLPRGGSPAAPAGPIVFPVPGLTGVPTSFRGDLEGPTPPAPGGTGPWPRGVSSGTVISMHFPGDTWTVTEHHLFSNPTNACSEVPVTYISRANDPNLNRGTPSNDVFMYANQPLTGATEYVAWMAGTYNGADFSRTWAFTTQ